MAYTRSSERAIAILVIAGCGGGGARQRPDAGSAGVVIDAGAGPWAVPVTYAAGQASVVVPSLTAYDIIVLSYP